MVYDRETNLENEQLRDSEAIRNRISLQSIYSRDLWSGAKTTITFRGGFNTRDKDISQFDSVDDTDPSLRIEDKKGSQTGLNLFVGYKPIEYFEIETRGDLSQGSSSLKNYKSDTDNTGADLLRMDFLQQSIPDWYWSCILSVNGAVGKVDIQFPGVVASPFKQFGGIGYRTGGTYDNSCIIIG